MKMPMSMKEVDADVFMEHNGVTIYHVYDDGIVENGPMANFYSVSPRGEEGGPQEFDIRDMPLADELRHKGIHDLENHAKAIIADAIDKGLITQVSVNGDLADESDRDEEE